MTKRIHNNEDSYLWSQCNNSNTSSIYLEQHMMIHTIDAQFQSQHCDMSSFFLNIQQYDFVAYI